MSNIQQIAALPESVLDTIPAAAPPPGVIPNFADPATLVPGIFGAGWTFFVLTLIFIVTRLYMKIFVLKKWQIEDTSIMLAFIFAVIFWGAIVQDCIHGQAGKHQYEQHLNTLLFPGWYFTYMIHDAFTYWPLGLIKVTILLQYWRLFSPKRWMRICVYIGMAMVIPPFFCLGIASIVLNSVWPGETQLTTLVSEHFLYAEKLVNPIGVIDVICDFYLLVIPIPLVYGLQLSSAKKIGIMMIFMTGILACVASIITCYYRFFQIAHPEDGTWNGGRQLMWTQLEMWTGIMVACMPTFHQFWHRHTGLIWLSNGIKTSITRVVTRSRESSTKAHASNANEKNIKDRRQMVRVRSDESVLVTRESHVIELDNNIRDVKQTSTLRNEEYGRNLEGVKTSRYNLEA